jgi:HlyD family secretion protein
MQTDVLEAQLEEVTAKYKQTLKMVDTTAARITVAENNLATAKAVAKQRETELDAANRRLARSQSLAKSGAISLQVLDDDRAQARSALAARDAAIAQIAANEAAIIAAKAEFNGAKSTVEAYIANIKRITVEINDSQLKAPCMAKVQYRIAQPGEVLTGGGKVLSLVDLRALHMQFFLPETIVGRISTGTEVRIILDAAPNYVIPAKISFISSVAQFTPKTVETASERQKLMFRVRARIDQDLVERNLNQVKTGVPGEAFIKLNPQASWPEELKLQSELQS